MIKAMTITNSIASFGNVQHPGIIFEKAKFNFIKCKSVILHRYYDATNVVSVSIFKSGWKNKYQCVEEWGEYETTEHHLYTAEEISKYYGIKTFSRKEKLDRINESSLQKNLLRI